jgi:hypothetical protein
MIAFIDDQRAVHGVEPICKVLPIAPSTRGGSVCLNRLARLLSGASAGFMPLREAVG